MKLESTALILDFDPLQTRTEAEATHNIGEAVYCADQRIFRHAKAGEALTAGNLSCAPAPDTALHTMAVVSGSKGSNQIAFTAGATTATAGAFNEGYAVISYGTGIGQTYKIANLEAITSGGSHTVYLYDRIVTALDTTSKLDLVHNTYNGVLEGTVATVAPAGVPIVAIASGDFGWLQTRGVCGVLSDATIAVGNTCVPDGSASGRIDIGSTTYGTFQATMPVGKAIVAGAQAYAHPVFLMID